MTPEQREFVQQLLQRNPGVPETAAFKRAALALLGLLKCGQEVKESAAQAVKHGIVGRWLSTVQPEE